MPNVDIAVVIIDPSVRAKILAKHSPLTPEDVRTALVYGQVTEAAWDEDEVHGRRLVVRTATYSGAEFRRLPAAGERGMIQMQERLS